MTEQEIQTNRLQRMMCCIAQKSLELSDILSLGNQKKIKCKTEELELLNIYFEILKCHIPTETIESAIVAMANNIENTIDNRLIAGDEIELILYNPLTNTPIIIPITLGLAGGSTGITYSWYAIDQIANNNSILGYTGENTIDRQALHIQFITVNNCSVLSFNTNYWGFEYHNITQDVSYNANLTKKRLLGSSRCIGECLDEDQIESIWDYICDKCD